MFFRICVDVVNIGFFLVIFIYVMDFIFLLQKGANNFILRYYVSKCINKGIIIYNH